MVCTLSSVTALGLVLLLARPDTTSARLLAGGRREPSLSIANASLPADFDLPVFHLLHSKQAAHTGAWALKGVPTHYESSGCKKVSKVYGKVANTGPSTAMSITKCFAFCSNRKGLSYFGLEHGTECWCGSAIDASPTDSSSCEKACPGSPSQMCGGIVGTSVYVMIDCTPATPQETAKERDDQKKALLSSYGSMDGETCGQASDNVVQLNNAGFISGSVDTCKLACWEGKGAEECHGFTYDSTMSKCTFHYDVTAGSVTKNVNSACYFKVS